jgi:NTP pyrophosphatase (non-canonical NTP hydrolase)|tara:strand:- start:1849 stop:2220 length:372 start_codon:yes stop_codon:yes gene_type:complete
MSKQSEIFYTLLDEMKEVHNAKRHDYADKADVFKNFRLSEMGGIPAWKGCAVRIGDKFSRLMSFLKQEELKVKDESIRDTLIDLANYALICAILYEEEKKEKVTTPYDWEGVPYKGTMLEGKD